MEKEIILEKIKEIQPSYLKNWKIDENDPGLAISEVFADMLSDLYKSFSLFPNKLLITTFDKLNYTQKEPIASTAPVVFNLVKNSKNGVIVPKYTRLETDNKISFETTKDYRVTSSKLIYLFDMFNNRCITDNTPNLLENKDMSIFSNNKKEEYLYFGDDHLFNLHKVEQDGIGLEFTVPKVENGNWEYYGKENSEVEAKWYPFFYRNNSIKLNKTFPYQTEKLEINGVKTYWIRVKTDKDIPNTFDMNFKSSSNIDGLFNNNIPLDIAKTKIIYPFGKFSQINNLFYISSSEAFSKIGFKIEIDFFDDKIFNLKEEQFSWEYWNSKSWKPLSSNSFIVPHDISKIEINGEENYWIRIRLLDNRDYLSYSYDSSNKLIQTVSPIEIRKIRINVQEKKEAINPKHIFQYKDLEYSTYPFNDDEIEDKTGIYFGFSKPFEFGLISLYIKMKEENQKNQNIAKWEIYTNSGWINLNMKDETNVFFKSGFLEFISQGNQEEKIIFNKNAYWIRALVEEKIEKRVIKNIFLNTINVRQSKTLQNVVLGSSDGSGSQELKLKGLNIFNLKLWVLEEDEVNDMTCFKDKFTDKYWVLWSQVNHLHQTQFNSRVYELNSHLSKINFGDDRNGKIPPLGKNNIMISYSIGGGIKGNVALKTISKLADSISFIDSIDNPIEASGGADIQSIDNLMQIAPKRFKHRYKAVTKEDFVYLAKEASNNIAKVSVIATNGLVRLIIIPFGEQKIPMPTLGLKNLVLNYINERASAVTQIEVLDPEPIALNIEVDISLTNWDYATNIKNIINKELDSFLHPITGGINKDGWEFGQLPSLSGIYKYISLIEGVYEVSAIKVSLANGKAYSLSSQKIPLLNNTNLIYSGSHTVNITKKGA